MFFFTKDPVPVNEYIISLKGTISSKFSIERSLEFEIATPLRMNYTAVIRGIIKGKLQGSISYFYRIHVIPTC